MTSAARLACLRHKRLRTSSADHISDIEPQSLWGCSSHRIPSTQNCLKPLRSKNLPDLDNRYFVTLIDVISIHFVSVRNKVVGSREITRPWWVVSYHTVLLLLHFLWLHQKTAGSSMQLGRHPLYLASHHSPACPLSSLPSSARAARSLQPELKARLCRFM